MGGVIHVTDETVLLPHLSWIQDCTPVAKMLRGCALQRRRCKGVCHNLHQAVGRVGKTKRFISQRCKS